MRALRAQIGGEVRFIGIGGTHMSAEGLELFFPHTELMHFGVVEVLRHIPQLVKRINQTVQEILRLRPAAVITIDSPDFCFRVAKKIRAANPDIPLVHYVAPTVWAWRPGRAQKIAKFLDHLLAVLPFEPPYFTREDLDCTFVGHSVVEGEAANGRSAIFRNARSLASDTPFLTILFGSRNGEFTRLAPIFREAVQILRLTNPGLQLVVPTVPHLKDRVAAEITTWNIPAFVVDGEQDKYDAFAASRAALACSGTVALELALARLPAVITYKINPLTYVIYRRLIYAPFVNLVNIMQGKEVVPEFLQDDCTPEKLAKAVDLLLRDETARQTQITQLASTAAWLGDGQFVPSQRAAETVLKAIEKKKTPPAPAILQVLPALVTGGVERGTVELTSALVKAGFRALVASSGGSMVAEVEAAGGTHITLPLKSKNPLTIFLNIFRLSRLIRDKHITLIHASSRAPAWSAYAAARRTNTPLVTIFHSAYGAGSKLKRLYNSVMAKGARVIAISDFVAAYAQKTYGVRTEILRIIPRGVDIAVFDSTKVSSERIEVLRRGWNLTETTPVILMPGRLTRWKGQQILIDALAQMERRNFVCVIVGGGKNSTYGKELAKEIQRAKLEKNISIFDTCRDMPAAYLLADAVIVPSTRPEGFGRVVIEAQAMGAPVIAANHGGARETVIEGETGWLVPAGDAAALAQRLAQVLDQTPAERSMLTQRATAHIRAHFTTDAMTAKTLAVYRELLQKRL